MILKLSLWAFSWIFLIRIENFYKNAQKKIAYTLPWPSLNHDQASEVPGTKGAVDTVNYDNFGQYYFINLARSLNIITWHLSWHISDLKLAN